MTKKATAADRRALSPEDVRDLLDIKRDVPTSVEYDPTFWIDLQRDVKIAGRRSHERMARHYVKRNLKFLQSYGWYPEGDGFLWEQLRADVQDGRINVDKKSQQHLLKTCVILKFFAGKYPPLAKIVG